MTDNRRPTTGFPAREAYLRARLQSAPIDEGSFERRLSPCDLALCAGTCCHDGVVLTEDEVNVIAALAEEHAPFLAECGVDQQTPLFRRGPDRQWRTNTLPRPMRRLALDYPSHFPETACVFLMNDARCALQVLSAHLGHHPWYYKPIPCWLHPITLGSDQNPRIFLPSEDDDPHADGSGEGGFAPHTHCGRTCPVGAPAREVLNPELSFLDAMLRAK